MSDDFIVPEPNRLDGDARRVCLICGRIVDYWDGPGGTGYRHSIASQDEAELDHPVVPVTTREAGDQLRERCDFCYADETTFLVPAKTFQLPGSPSVSVEDWAACELCGNEIEKNSWNGLFRRVLASWEYRLGPMSPATQTQLKAMYRALRKNMTGPIYRGQPK